MGTHGKNGNPQQKIVGMRLLKWKVQTLLQARKMKVITFHLIK
jgi:hypothetical protein